MSPLTTLFFSQTAIISNGIFFQQLNGTFSVLEKKTNNNKNPSRTILVSAEKQVFVYLPRVKQVNTKDRRIHFRSDLCLHILKIHPAEKSCGLDKQILSQWLLVSQSVVFCSHHRNTHLAPVTDSSRELGMASQDGEGNSRAGQIQTYHSFVCLSPMLVLRHLQSEIEKLRSR